MKLTELLKPDIKKIIVLLLLACPMTIWFLAPQFLEGILEQFDFLYIYLELSYLLLEVMYIFSLGIIPYEWYWGNKMHWMTVGVVFLYLALIYYVFSCMIVVIWNKAIRHFRGK